MRSRTPTSARAGLFRALAPSGLSTALLRMAQDWEDALGDVVAVDEDQARNREACLRGSGGATAPHCLAGMRRLALNIARMHHSKVSMRSKFWSYDFLLDMIRATRRRM